MKSRGHPLVKLTGNVRSCNRVIFILLVAGGLCLSTAQEAAPAVKAKSEKAKSASVKEEVRPVEAAAANAGLKAFGQMIPLGSRSRGVRIPAFDNGKPSSLIIADAMTRVVRSLRLQRLHLSAIHLHNRHFGNINFIVDLLGACHGLEQLQRFSFTRLHWVRQQNLTTNRG